MTDEKSSFTERLIAAEHTRDRSSPVGGSIPSIGA
jgi:hypothetical protein